MKQKIKSTLLKQTTHTLQITPCQPSSFLAFFCVFFLCVQQAFNATAVVRHMRRLQLGTNQEGTSPSTCQDDLLMPEENKGTGIVIFFIMILFTSL